ncbi:MAG: SusC/RagA family TonB-linked outer membrane protein, partial [Chitinophagaceae bacterium]
MNRRRLLALALFQCVFLISAYSQKKEITGRVIDSASSEPLNGVSILGDKKGVATSTKSDGTYTLQVDNKVTTLIFSSVGYNSQSFPVGAVPSTISLSKSAAAMDEVVVIGYGTTKRSNVTGAVSKYSNQRMDEQPVSRVDQALQGKIAGVQVQNVSSEAGSDPKIRVRGLSSINAGASPLVVVDGHPVQDGLNFVNPADVASVEVLKDAASAAIYGSRGASGVILITTKSGKTDRPKYNIKYSTGVKHDYKRYDMLTMSEYANLLFYEASLRAQDPLVPANQQNLINSNERAAYVIENSIVGGPTDWQSQALRNATVQNVQMNVSGGSRTLKYYISGGYQDDPGMMYHSEYKKYNIRTKLEAQLSNRVKITLNTNPSYIKRERPSVNYIDFVRFYSYLPVYHTDATAAYVNSTGGSVKVGDFVQANDFNSRTYSGYMPDGSFWTSGNTATTPFSTSNNTPKSTMERRTINSNEYRMLTSGDITVNILPGLDFKMLGSAYIAYTSSLDFAKRNAARQGDLNRGQYDDRRFVDLLWENTLNYSKKFGNHEVTAVAGFTSQKTRIRDQRAVGQ